LALVLALCIGALGPQAASAATFEVTKTVDDGSAGTLRWAIDQANNTAGADRITFGISSGLKTIAVTSPLPTITEAVEIDATTQPGYAGTPLIELDGTGAGTDANGLSIGAGGTVVRGLVINRFSGAGIAVQSGSGTGIVRNYIGTNASGNVAGVGNTAAGVRILGSSANTTVGGTNLADGNLIAGNFQAGVFVAAGTNGAVLLNTIYGNSGLGIDLEPAGPNTNSANGTRNAPVLTSVSSASSSTTIGGTLNSTPNRTYRLEFYSSATLNLFSTGEGRTFLTWVTATTDGNGNASFSTTAGVELGAGTYVSATATDLTANATSEFSRGLAVGSAPWTITAAAGTLQSARVATAFAARLQATVRDSVGAPVSGVVVTFSAPASGPSGSFSGGGLSFSGITDNNGAVTAPDFTANTVAGGPYLVSASVSGVAPATFSLTNIPGDPASITATAGTPQSTTINTTFATALKATVRDAFGNPVPGVSVTFIVPTDGPGAQFTGNPVVPTDANGTATAPPLTANGNAGEYTVVANVTGLAPAQFNLRNTVGAADAVTPLTGTTPQTTTVNTAFGTRLKVIVKSGNNPLPNVEVVFEAPNEPGQPGGIFQENPKVKTDSNGEATAPPLIANLVAGSFTVSAQVENIAQAAGFNLTNLPGQAFSIVACAGTPQGKTVNAFFDTNLCAAVRDIFNNPVPGVPVTFTAPADGPGGSFGSDRTANVTTGPDGRAIAPQFRAGTLAGNYQVSAEAAGVAGEAIFSLSNAPGAPAVPSPCPAEPRSITVNTTAPSFQLTLRDGFGNPVPGVNVTFIAPEVQPNGPGGLFEGDTTVSTNAQGVAAAPPFKVNTVAGSYTVRANVIGLTPCEFPARNVAGPAQNIRALGSTSNAAGLGVTLPDRFSVRVTDPYGNPMAGLVVTFTAPANGASGTFLALGGSPGAEATATTGGDGVAIPPPFTTNQTPGNYNIVVSVPGTGNPAVFNLRNLPPRVYMVAVGR
jgi:hypothetical protein